MSKRTFVVPVELDPNSAQVLKAVDALGENEATFPNIWKKLESLRGGKVTSGYVGSHLDRLEGRGLISSRKMDVSGEVHRHCIVTKRGAENLLASREGNSFCKL